MPILGIIMFLRLVLVILLSSTVFNVVQCEINRLPENVKPIRYFLTMEPRLDGRRLFNGSVVIEIAISENTSNIVLHQNNLQIDAWSIAVTSSRGSEIKLKTISEDAETCTIGLESELVKNEFYNLTIGNFSGVLNTKSGFLLSYYTWDRIFTYRFQAVSHLEFMGARKAFPCFDEPALKAKFTVSLVRPSDYNSVSNAELETTENLGNDRFKDTFKETPLMSTYTLAFAVSDFKFTKKVRRNRVWAKPSAIEDGKADFAVDMGAKILETLEEYTGINFTMSKLDHFAIDSSSFPRSAMENWGLVIYRSAYLLSSNQSTADQLEKIVITMAHELSHMWFGNLVTPAWWDYLWLNEGFATYFGYYIAAQVKPSWRLMDQFPVEILHDSFHAEELMGVYPLNFPVSDSYHFPPSHIIYYKGGSLLRMAEHFLTADVFRKGLQIYLHKNQFDNVVPSDLYNALQESVDKAGTSYLLNNKTIGEIFGTWDSNIGFPIVTVTRDYKTGKITVEQVSRFDHKATNTNTWIIPINFAFSSSSDLVFSKTTADFWLTEKRTTINETFPTNGWLIINKQQTGYYRVNYDLENWERIIQTLNSENFTSIHVINRAQLINDALNLAAYKEIPWNIPLRLCEYLVREKDYVPFAAFYDAFEFYVLRGLDDFHKAKEFEYFQNVISSDVTDDNLWKRYLKSVLSGVQDLVEFKGTANDAHLTKLHKSKFFIFQNRWL